MRLTPKNILLAVFVFVTFVPVVVFSPQTVSEHLTRWFNLHAPALPPEKHATGPAALAEEIQDLITETTVRKHLEELTQNGSRVVGYPGHDAASRYIQQEFERIGLERVAVEAYDVTSPVDKGGTLEVLGDGRQIPIHAVWPNLVRTSTLPKSGLQSPLVDGGNGEFKDFNVQQLKNSVVQM